MLGRFSERQQQGTIHGMRRVPKSQPGSILDMGETGSTFYFILIYSEKNVQDEEASGEFPTGRRDIPARRDTLHHPSQQDPTRDLSVSTPPPQSREETSLFQAALGFDAILWSGKALQRVMWSIFLARQKTAAENWPWPHHFEQTSFLEGDFHHLILCLFGNRCPEHL